MVNDIANCMNTLTKDQYNRNLKMKSAIGVMNMLICGVVVGSTVETMMNTGALVSVIDFGDVNHIKNVIDDEDGILLSSFQQGIEAAGEYTNDNL